MLRRVPYADGNTLTGSGRTNTWDSENRMSQCVNCTNTSSFTYGADGIRRRSVVNTVAEMADMVDEVGITTMDGAMGGI